jgi:hypothetical protein
LVRREPRPVRAAWVWDGAKRRRQPGRRRSISSTHARCSEPVASIATTGGPVVPERSISRSSSSIPARETDRLTGSPITPRSPLANITRLETFPQSTATTSVFAGSSLPIRCAMNNLPL